MQISLQEQIAGLKRETFLRRIAEVSEGDPSRWVPVGLLGQQMGLAYEDALAIADRLRESGFIRRGGGGPLDPPFGPRVHILPEGLAHLRGEDRERTARAV
ncbi:MAG TPA: hypothetical protein VHG28_16610 [Longimicrobiaceae bacterium]|nr:hypothetical protein [Longimicrobiaceae bacterium]